MLRILFLLALKLFSPLSEHKRNLLLFQPKNYLSSRSSRLSPPLPSSPSSSEDNDEFIEVNLSAVRPYVECPICLEILKNTRTSTECLHRFCKKCIDKAMRLGNKNCPTCRKHFASRRSFRNDLRFDSIIKTLYPDIDKYEEEESSLKDEEIIRNREFQTSIAKIRKRQTEASRSPAYGKQKIFKSDNSEDVSDSAGSVERRERPVVSRGSGRIQKGLCWGSGGPRSQLRSASAPRSQTTLPIASGGIGDKNDEMDIHLALTPLDEQIIPRLDQPYLRCSPSCSVRQLSEFAAQKIGLEPEELEMVFVKGGKSGIQILGERETLAVQLHFK